MHRIVIVCLCVVLTSCIVHQLDIAPINTDSAEPLTITTPVKAHLHDGSTVVFTDGVTVTNNTITGKGRSYDLSLDNSTSVTTLSMDDIAAMESFQTPVNAPATTVASVGSSVGIVYGAALAALIIFGSCPTVYSFDGDTAVLEAETFSYSIAPSFQSRDIDRLGVRTSADGLIELELRNEMLETHYIDQLKLIEVTHASNEQAYPDDTGRPLIVGQLRPPLKAWDQTGRSILEQVQDADDRQWSATDDRMNLVSEADFMDHLDFEFDTSNGADDLALVLRMRNSLLSTVLFYDIMLKQQGFGALDWLGEDLGRLSNKIRLGLWYRKQMGATVSVWRNGRYQKIGKLGDQGPIAWSEHAIRLPALQESRLKVRLSFVADSWRIDQVAIADGVRRSRVRTIPVSRVSGVAGERSEIPDYLKKPDKTYLITQPQDWLRLYFDVGFGQPDQQRTFFLASEGYYIEWMRAQWLRQPERRPFAPGDNAILQALAIWKDSRSTFREQFESTRLTVR